MEWQYRVNRGSEIVCLVSVFMLAPEVIAAFRYHFPWWDDVLILMTPGIFIGAWLIRRYTSMYRIDL
jgi:hypothetical protein